MAEITNISFNVGEFQEALIKKGENPEDYLAAVFVGPPDQQPFDEAMAPDSHPDILAQRTPALVIGMGGDKEKNFVVPANEPITIQLISRDDWVKSRIKITQPGHGE